MPDAEHGASAVPNRKSLKTKALAQAAPEKSFPSAELNCQVCATDFPVIKCSDKMCHRWTKSGK